ncbi:uncharacterized protein [Clytia hemisphaerica]|uniref:uncharacterized protein n=1 Tax=Clytia hemisphaerica TaxID=252671 RepID=UPI0034D4F933
MGAHPFKFDKEACRWILLYFTLCILFKGASTLPVSGGHIQMDSQQDLTTSNQWVSLSHWESGQYKKGLFMSDFEMDGTTFFVKRSGVYFASLYVHLEQATSKDFAIRIHTNQKESYTSIGKSTSRINVLHLNQILLLNENQTFTVDVNCSHSNTISQKTVISIHFISNFAYTLGFIANPNEIQTVKSQDYEQVLVNWNVMFETSYGFSAATGQYTALESAYYVITVQLTLRNVYGKVMLSLRNDDVRDVIKEEYFEDLSEIVTMTYSGIHRINEKRNILLSVKTFDCKAIIDKRSVYSVMRTETIYGYQASYSSHDDKSQKAIIEKNNEIESESKQTLKHWRTFHNHTAFLKNRAMFQLRKSSLYFVYVQVKMKSMDAPTDLVDVELCIDERTNKYSLSRQNEGSLWATLAGVFYIQDSQDISIIIHNKSPNPIEIVGDQTSIYISELSFQTHSSTYAVVPISDEKIHNGSLYPVALTMEATSNFNMVTKAVRNIITIQHEGTYHVSLNLYLQNIKEDIEFIVMSRLDENRMKWNTLSKCITGQTDQCFVASIMRLKEGQQLMVSASTPLNDVIVKESFFQITFLRSQDETTKTLQTRMTKDKSTRAEVNPVFKFNDGDNFYLLTLNLILGNVSDSHIRVKFDFKLGRLWKPIKKFQRQLNENQTRVSFTLTEGFYARKGSEIKMEVINLKGGSYIIETLQTARLMLPNNEEGKARFKHLRVDTRAGVQSVLNFVAPKRKHSNGKYFTVVNYLKAEKSSTALLMVTLEGHLKCQNHQRHRLKAKILLRKTETTIQGYREELKCNEFVSLHMTGVVVAHVEDSIKVLVETDRSSSFTATRQTTITLLVLKENPLKIPPTSDLFLSKSLVTDDTDYGKDIQDIEAGGLYEYLVTLERSQNKRIHFEFSVEKNHQNSRTITKRDTSTSPKLFIFSYQEKKHIRIKILVNLQKGQQIKYSPQVDDVELQRRKLYALNLKQLNTIRIDKVHEICHNSNKVSILSGWRCSDGTHCDSLHIANISQTVVINANIFVKTRNLKKLEEMYIAVAGNVIKKFSMTSPQPTGANTYLLQASYRIFMKRGERLQLHVRCQNKTNFIQPNSMVQIYIEAIHKPIVDESFPVFLVHLSPNYVNRSFIFNYTCQAQVTGQQQQDVKYSWNKVGYYSHVLHSHLSNGDFHTVSGQPAESGHYFCSAEYQGFSSQSQTATLHIYDEDECLTLSNTTHRELYNITLQPCHTHAQCINTIGSYTCQCFDGYQGDGFQCQDLNECDEVDNICGEDSDCFNTVGSYKCQCHKGYEGIDGKQCKDIDECVRHGPELCQQQTRSNNTFCINTDGGFFCNCTEGFYKKKGLCIDIDECGRDPYPCHAEATCLNSPPGSYSCECDQGWLGNGTHCEDIDECKQPEKYKCAANATCHNFLGSYRCICDHGFKGEGSDKCEPLGCFPPPGCSGQFLAKWWRRIPYIEQDEAHEKAEGLFKDILNLIITDICQNCSQILFDMPPANNSKEVEDQVEANQTDFGCPMYGSKEQESFRDFPFIPIVESPGVAFFVKDIKQTSSPLLGSLTGSWPILVMTLLLASVSGIIIWFLDTIQNPDEFPQSFLQGSWEGFWWAFITMTTVGYGDKAPRSFSARLFGVFWILVGLVIISTFTATITTVLTTTTLTSETKLYGTRVGALNNSEEFRLGVKRNADIQEYNSIREIIQALQRDEIQGALLDTYIAGEYQSELKEYKLQEILEHVFVYGVVLARDAIQLENRMRTFTEQKQSTIYNTISKVIKPLKEIKHGSNTVTESVGLFDSSSSFFTKTMIFGCILLAFLVIVGLLWDWLWRQQMAKQKAMDSMFILLLY